MIVIRNFELLGMLRSVKIKQNGKLIGRVSTLSPTKNIDLQGENSNIEIVFDLFRKKVDINKNSIIVVKHNKAFSSIGIIAWISITIAFLFWGKYQYLDYLLLVFPIIYLSMLVYYSIFNRRKFLDVEIIK
jgi:hypothetical protein